MNSVDYTGKYNRQREIFQRNLDDANRSHKDHVENLKETQANNLENRSENYSKSIDKMEKSFENSVSDIRQKQAESLKEKTRSFELAKQKNIKDFHEERKENLKDWKRKISSLRSDFNKNIEQNETSRKEEAVQQENNYENRVQNVRQNSRSSLDNFIETVEASKNKANQGQAEQIEEIREGFIKDRNKLIKDEQQKRNFILANVTDKAKGNREKAEKNYIQSKELAQNKFSEMVQKQDARIDDVVNNREQRWNKNLQDSEVSRNREFSKRYEELSQLYDKNLRDIQLKSRSEKLTRGELDKELEKSYRENLANQFQNQKETLIDERQELIRDYDKRIGGTVESYQTSIREGNIEHMGEQNKLQNRLLEDARKDRFKAKTEQERIIHENTSRLNYVEEKNDDRRVHTKSLTEKKIINLKKDFSESMEKARKASMRNFEVAKNEMVAEKREMAQRLHEQNSEQNSTLKELHNDKLNKITRSYEKRIAELELQNKLIQQNSTDTVQGIMRKTALEIDRQREASIKSAESEIRTERRLSKEKESALHKRIDTIQVDFNEKMNEQTLSSRKKLKDVKFELTSKLQEESRRYQGIIDQNNKFFARELERLQMSSSTERERLVEQYEGRIAQLKKAYAGRLDDMRQSSV